MNYVEFVRKSVVQEAVKAGAAEDIASRQADIAVSAYKQGRFKKASALIIDSAKAAVKLTQERSRSIM